MPSTAPRHWARRSGGAIRQNVNFPLSSIKRDPYLIFAIPKFLYPSCDCVRDCPGTASSRLPNSRFEGSLLLKETRGWLRKLKAEALNSTFFSPFPTRKLLITDRLLFQYAGP